MAYTVAQLKGELSGITGATSLARVENINGLIYRAARQVLLDVDPIETVRNIPLGVPISQDVYEYPCPPDLKADRMLDIGPTGDRSGFGKYHQIYNEAFDVNKDWTNFDNPFTIEWKNGNKVLRVSSILGEPPIVVDQFTDGTLYTGNATSIITDTVNFILDEQSVRFTAPVGTSYIERTLPSVLDLSTTIYTGAEYIRVYLPNASAVTSIELRIGQTVNDYWVQSVTTTAQSTTFQNGWNTLVFKNTAMTTVGSPQPSQVQYVRISMTVTTEQNVNVNLLQSASGQEHFISYYSKYLFRNATTGAFQETITSADDTELINLDTDSYNLLVYQTGIQAFQQSQPLGDASSWQWLSDKYMETKDRYIANIKSQAKRTSSTYYDSSVRRYPFRGWFR